MPPQVKNTNSIFSNLVEVKKGQKSQAIAPDTSTHKKLVSLDSNLSISSITLYDSVMKLYQVTDIKFIFLPIIRPDPTIKSMNHKMCQ